MPLPRVMHVCSYNHLLETAHRLKAVLGMNIHHKCCKINNDACSAVSYLGHLGSVEVGELNTL